MIEQTTSEPISSHRRGRRWGHRRVGVTAGACATLGLLGALAGCGSNSTATDPAADSSASGDDGVPSAVGSPIQAPSDTSTTTTTVPVYLVGDSPSGPRLYRAPVAVPQDAPLAGAVQYLMSGKTPDPDYRSSYDSGAFGEVTYDPQKGFTVALTDPALERAHGMSRHDAMIATQQLVYTLEAVQGTKDAPVRVIADGRPTRLFGVSTADGLKPVDQLDVLNLVNVLSPTDRAHVAGSFEAGGLASSPEATVPWTVENSNGKVVRRGFATASGWMDRLYPWKATVSGLAPGTYTFTATTDDTSDGEGTRPSTDTKTFTVTRGAAG